MKISITSLAAVLVLLLESTSGAQCRGRTKVLHYCGSDGKNECSFSTFTHDEPKNNSVISYARACGESTGRKCKGMDASICLFSPQCIWWSTWNKDDNIRKDSECREFDCSYGWSQKYCEYFQKECIYDTKDNKCKDKNPRKKGIWETANDHIESTTGRRLDGK
ncbi:predicted protein [Lichtheimia corymbifera JMRC:FSU:9682]|uniref:Secreted protein n=1 Tax=Lichtheimia corymbifera JMRC:FSU:9682 TaxID=1263082 RepID=A0A068SA70_9FUNG|nr:predicted protein [Lichtheimia corymbifera JMRC:FSU:9682]